MLLFLILFISISIVTMTLSDILFSVDMLLLQLSYYGVIILVLWNRVFLTFCIPKILDNFPCREGGILYSFFKCDIPTGIYRYSKFCQSKLKNRQFSFDDIFVI